MSHPLPADAKSATHLGFHYTDFFIHPKIAIQKWRAQQALSILNGPIHRVRQPHAIMTLHDIIQDKDMLAQINCVAMARECVQAITQNVQYLIAAEQNFAFYSLASMATQPKLLAQPEGKDFACEVFLILKRFYADQKVLKAPSVQKALLKTLRSMYANIDLKPRLALIMANKENQTVFLVQG